ncbi:hypothetical protein [Noviherbaspirillum galbum]|uniref:XRE family transcriptional regulator n=1 Tax=Noviherbaspirillum galbum TaxID=2709383 RepID=A0A6B3SM41_9BURK|nr:hypothetical protein [Noviherbaspirillum galbum]NEX60375.1 hypothetical protein [Noviherbaspirillum galbum]
MSKHQETSLPASLPYDPNRLLDALLAWMQLDDDNKLARALRLSPELIKSIRHGRLPIRPTLLMLMAEHAGRSLDELRQILGDRRSKARMPGRRPLA